jgi:hypothetical protein
MAVSIGLLNKATGEYREVPVATLATFRNAWLPLCERLGLLWVPLFAGGALTTVPEHAIPDIIRELHTLAAELSSDPDMDWLRERVDAILAAFAETNPAEWEYDFG